MLHNLLDIAEKYLTHESSYDAGYVGVYHSINHYHDLDYAKGLYYGKHFILLEYYISCTGLIYNVIRFILHAHTKEQIKFTYYVVNRISYDLCLEYLNENPSIEFTIVLLKQALYLKQDEMTEMKERIGYGRKVKLSFPIAPPISPPLLILNLPEMPKMIE
jgi:hypothetical protein